MMLVFALAALLACAGTWLARRLALRSRFVDHPNPIIADGRAPVAYGGGAGILFGALAGLFLVHQDIPTAILMGVVLFALLGMADDCRAFTPPYKFALQAIAAVVVIVIGRDDLVHPLTGGMPIDAFIAWLWIVTLVNAVNFVDVCDGLAATIAGLSLCLWGLVPGYAPYPGVALAFAGACAGFVVWNRPPATIYMGDGGSNALGFVLAAIMLTSQRGVEPHRAIVMNLLWAGVPLFELVFISVVRIRKGLPWWRGSPDHFSLRLQRAGFTKWQVNLISGVAVVCLWSAAAVMKWISLPLALALMIVILMATAAVWRRLLRWEPSSVTI